MKRSLLLIAGMVACSISSIGLAPAFSQSAPPKPAPDFRAARTDSSTAGGNEESVAFTKKSTFVVTPKEQAPLSGGVARFDASAERPPLNGQVSRLDAGAQGGLLRGQAGPLIDTPPVISGAVSKQVPPEMFRAWLDKSHPGFLLTVSSNPPNSLIEVKGRWDDAGRTLRSLGIPYQRVGGGDLRDLPLDGVKVLVVDCAGNVPKESFQRIRDFVSRGGYLLTTDWALGNLVERAFPGYVEYDRKKNEKPIYDAYVVNPDPVLFANVVTHAHWKMDEASHLMRVLKPGSVRVLARSRELEREDPGGKGVLAVTFPFGRGYVMHMIGHFDNNAFFKFTNSLPDPAPQIGISLRQAMAANFVVAGLSGSKIP